MNNSGEHKRFHFTYKESVPAQSVKLWDVPALGFTNGSKVMIPAIRIGPRIPFIRHEHVPDFRISIHEHLQVHKPAVGNAYDKLDADALQCCENFFSVLGFHG
jgi:hypothetical protein